jgi:hypothetical protein
VLLLISSEEGEVERWMVAIEQRLPVLPLFQQREVGWRRWSSVVVPLSRKNQQILSLSQEPLEEIKKKEIIIVFSRSPSQYLSFQYGPRQKK